MKTLRRLVLCTAFALLPQACASFHIQTPGGFAELSDDARYDYRATNADGVVLAVRAVANEPEAGLDFWSRVVDERLRRQGYVGDGPSETLHDARGIPGTVFRYHATHEGRAHRYVVAVFVRGNKVFVVEAGGDREVFDPASPAVERALRSFRS